MMKQVILAENHSIVRVGIKSVLDATGGYNVAAELDEASGLTQLAIDVEPDLIIVDLLIPGGDTLSSLLEIKRCCKSTKILIFTALDSPKKLKKMCATAIDGILLKQDSSSELIKAIEVLNNGKRYLSPNTLKYTSYEDIHLTTREVQILHLILLGFKRSHIAEKLEVSPETIKSHRKNLMRKLNAKNITQLINRAKELELY